MKSCKSQIAPKCHKIPESGSPNYGAIAIVLYSLVKRQKTAKGTDTIGLFEPSDFVSDCKAFLRSQ
jgi:hypothetical protein